MRIVAGKYGSRSLKTLSGTITRPTSDKIRGAIFSKIGPYFDGETFFDVFGGSGAMALEALSRGMSRATIIEKNHKAYQVIKGNIQMFDEASNVTLIKGDAFNAVNGIKGTFDIVFMDPPYGYTKLVELATRIIDGNLITSNGELIIETDGIEEIPKEISNWSCYDVKDYKTTVVYYYKLRDCAI